MLTFSQVALYIIWPSIAIASSLAMHAFGISHIKLNTWKLLLRQLHFLGISIGLVVELELVISSASSGWAWCVCVCVCVNSSLERVTTCVQFFILLYIDR